MLSLASGAYLYLIDSPGFYLYSINHNKSLLITTDNKPTLQNPITLWSFDLFDNTH